MSEPAFCLAGEGASWPMARWWPQGAGLTVGFVSTAVLLPAPEALVSPGQLRALALRSTLPVFVAVAVAVYAACRAVGAGSNREAMRTAVGLACAAAWFAPLALLLRPTPRRRRQSPSAWLWLPYGRWRAAGRVRRAV